MLRNIRVKILKTKDKTQKQGVSYIREINLNDGILSETMEPRGSRIIFFSVKEKNCQPRTLYPANILQKLRGFKIFSEEFVASRPTLKEQLKDFL